MRPSSYFALILVSCVTAAVTASAISTSPRPGSLCILLLRTLLTKVRLLGGRGSWLEASNVRRSAGGVVDSDMG
ncbi:hypothetical protein BKA70DRAFT_1282389 [Coprinopsis sp. MPI-PUGE-AT-0042]|nr:hypothetical protein BKA70DRAFT_1282389 [Coprinopsis sp. MPI-PUGE-AT-0042]